jgi:hypothetical protein
MPEEITTTEEVIQSETSSSEFETLPDDHPLVKSLAAQRQEMKEVRKAFAHANNELEEFRKASLSDQERLVASAREEAAATVRREYAGKFVEAELKNAIVGKIIEATALLSFDRNSFIDDSGEVDSNAIAAWVEAHTKAPEVSAPDLGQGIRGKTPNSKAQLTRADLANMTSAQILEARLDGRLNSAMGKN